MGVWTGNVARSFGVFITFNTEENTGDVSHWDESEDLHKTCYPATMNERESDQRVDFFLVHTESNDKTSMKEHVKVLNK